MNNAEKQNVAIVGVGSTGGSAGLKIAGIIAKAAAQGIRIAVVDSVPLSAPDMAEMVIQVAKECQPQYLPALAPEKEWWRGGRPR